MNVWIVLPVLAWFRITAPPAVGQYIYLNLSRFPKLMFSLSAILSCLSSSLHAQRFGEDSFNYLGDRPTEAQPGWHDAVQGLAHDHDNWFITQKNAIWKIPIAHDLAVPAVNMIAGVRRVGLNQISQLHGRGYDHFGDPELFTTAEGRGYLFVPVTEYGPVIAPAIAVFRGEDLSYVTHQVMPFEFRPAMAWCAFDPQGNLYVPNFGTNRTDPLTLIRYTCNFHALEASPPSSRFLTYDSLVELDDEAGLPVDVDWSWQQGGVISPSGELLYIVAGSDASLRDGHGIHVFQLHTNPLSHKTTGMRIKRSSNGSRPFSYAFDPGTLSDEEPEGITFWDLDSDGRAPGIGGQLHVLLLDTFNWLVGDDVFVKHYTSAIYVDGRFPSGGLGIPNSAFKTIAPANNLAWNGADIRIRTGSYPETMTFSKRVRLRADGGPVTIGR